MTRDSQDTLRPEEIQAEIDRGILEQRELTENLLQDPDPMTRLIAHMSQRQLDMHERVVKIEEEAREIKEQLQQLLRRRSLTPSGGISMLPRKED